MGCGKIPCHVGRRSNAELLLVANSPLFLHRRGPGFPAGAVFGTRWASISKIEKHQGRRFPAASIEQAFSIRRLSVSGCLAESIQLIKSLRPIGVKSLHSSFSTASP